MSIAVGAFTEVEAAGANFVAGGYTRTANAMRRGYWTGDQPTYSETILETPTLAPGTPVRFRWELFFDNSILRGSVYLDDIQVTAAAPPPAPVPTLSDWAMTLFGTILAGGAALHLQRRLRIT